MHLGNPRHQDKVDFEACVAQWLLARPRRNQARLLEISILGFRVSEGPLCVDTAVRELTLSPLKLDLV
jgi:hypothetical protein